MRERERAERERGKEAGRKGDEATNTENRFLQGTSAHSWLWDACAGGGLAAGPGAPGLVHPAVAAAVLDSARAAVSSGAAPWAAVSAWGVRDAPVSWQLRDEGKVAGATAAAAAATAAGGVDGAGGKANAKATATAKAKRRKRQRRQSRAPSVPALGDHGFAFSGENDYTVFVLPGGGGGGGGGAGGGEQDAGKCAGDTPLVYWICMAAASQDTSLH